MRFGSFLMGFGKSAEARPYSLKELIDIYEGKEGRKHTARAYQIAARKCEKKGVVAISRNEMLWIAFPSGVKRKNKKISENIEHRSKAKNKTSNRSIGTPNHPLHTTHRIKLSIPFNGTQPKSQYPTFYGRNHSQVRYLHISGGHNITAYTRKLNIWIHRPPGNNTPEQLINAKAQGYRALLEFAKAHNLRLEGYLNRVLRSHHVLDDKQLNEALKPIFEPNEKEIYERIGSHICRTSHPGKIEHEGVRRPDGSVVQGSDVARNVEYLFTRFPSDFAELAKANVEFRENLKTHLKVMQDIGETLKAIKKEIKKG